jgi:hypothetical protein
VSGEVDLTYAEVEPRVTDPAVEYHEVTTAHGLAGLLDSFERRMGVAL